MTESALDDLARRIRSALNCGSGLARDYAMAIGDKPEVQGGQVLVRNAEGRIITRIPASVVTGEGK